MREWPERVLDHIDVLNLGHFGRGVDYEKLKALRKTNFISVPWSYPTRKIVNLCEVLDMYQFKGIVALPYIRNKGIKALRKRAKGRIIVPRDKKNFESTIRSNIASIFLRL